MCSCRDTQHGIASLSVGSDGKLYWFERTLQKTEPELYPGLNRATLRVMSLTSLTSVGGRVTGLVGERHPAYLERDTQLCGVFTSSIAVRCLFDADHMIIRYGLKFSSSLSIIIHLYIFQLSSRRNHEAIHN